MVDFFFCLIAVYKLFDFNQIAKCDQIKYRLIGISRNCNFSGKYNTQLSVYIQCVQLLLSNSNWTPYKYRMALI